MKSCAPGHTWERTAPSHKEISIQHFLWLRFDASFTYFPPVGIWQNLNKSRIFITAEKGTVLLLPHLLFLSLGLKHGPDHGPGLFSGTVTLPVPWWNAFPFVFSLKVVESFLSLHFSTLPSLFYLFRGLSNHYVLFFSTLSYRVESKYSNYSSSLPGLQLCFDRIIRASFSCLYSGTLVISLCMYIYTYLWLIFSEVIYGRGIGAACTFRKINHFVEIIPMFKDRKLQPEPSRTNHNMERTGAKGHFRLLLHSAHHHI